jgi:hypothetical protein
MWMLGDRELWKAWFSAGARGETPAAEKAPRSK